MTIVIVRRPERPRGPFDVEGLQGPGEVDPGATQVPRLRVHLGLPIRPPCAQARKERLGDHLLQRAPRGRDPELEQASGAVAEGDGDLHVRTL